MAPMAVFSGCLAETHTDPLWRDRASAPAPPEFPLEATIPCYKIHKGTCYYESLKKEQTILELKKFK
jgi:hypothetical protein